MSRRSSCFRQADRKRNTKTKRGCQNSGRNQSLASKRKSYAEAFSPGDAPGALNPQPLPCLRLEEWAEAASA